jgi:hypothetical protein
MREHTIPEKVASEFLLSLAAEQAEDGLILAGGQSVNFRVLQHLRDRPGEVEEWKEFLPLASHDFDFLGNMEQASSLHRALDNIATVDSYHYNRNAEPAPTVATFRVTYRDETFLVDVLLDLPGLRSREEIRFETLEFHDSSRSIKIIHPLPLLINKVHCVARLDQERRQDRKHARIALRLNRAIMRELIQEGVPGRTILKYLKALTGLHACAEGQKAREQGVLMEEALPLTDLRAMAETDPAMRQFFSKSWPTLTEPDAPRYLDAVPLKHLKR